MAIESSILIDRLKAKFPDADIRLIDYRGDANHYQLVIKSKAFAGHSLVAQHKLVYEALGNVVGGDLHALSVTTLPIED